MTNFKPFTLIVDNKLQGYFTTLQAVKYALEQMRASVIVSSWRIYDESHGRQSLIEEN